MALARSQEAWERLSQLVRARALERSYLALVHGRPLSRAGRIEAPIGRDRDDPTRISLASASPREAMTHFEVERCGRTTRSCAYSSRPGGCTRSACIWRRSTSRSSAIVSTA